MILFVSFMAVSAGASNWVHVSTDTSTGKMKYYVDTDTIRVYDGYIRHSNIMENSAGFGSLSHYLSVFLKPTPLEKPQKTVILQYILNCKNRSSFVKSAALELTNGKTESATFDLTHSSQFKPIFPDTNMDNVAEFVCKFQ